MASRRKPEERPGEDGTLTMEPGAPASRREMRELTALSAADLDLLVRASRGEARVSPQQLRALELRARMAGVPGVPGPGPTPKAAASQEAADQAADAAGVWYFSAFGNALWLDGRPSGERAGRPTPTPPTPDGKDGWELEYDEAGGTLVARRASHG